MAHHGKQYTEAQRAKMREHKRNKPSTGKRLQKRSDAREEVFSRGEASLKTFNDLKAKIEAGENVEENRAKLAEAAPDLLNKINAADALRSKLDSYKAA